MTLLPGPLVLAPEAQRGVFLGMPRFALHCRSHTAQVSKGRSKGRNKSEDTSENKSKSRRSKSTNNRSSKERVRVSSVRALAG